MILSSTTDKLSLITDQAGGIDVVVTFIDRDQTTGAVGEANRQLTTITTATTTDVLAAPAATTERKVESITIRNTDGSTSQDLLVQYDANGTLYEMHAARLYPTEALQYSIEDGFVHLKRSPSKFYGVCVEISGPGIATTNPNQSVSLPGTFQIPRSDVGGLTRSFGLFGCFNALSSDITVGDKHGFRVWDQTLVFGREAMISCATLSATAASITTATAATLTNVTLGKATGILINSLSVVAAGFQFTESTVDTISVTAQIEAENDVGTVTSNASWFQCFEATD